MLISADNTKARRVSDSPILPKGNIPSVGIKTANLKLEAPPEREKWKIIAKEWRSNDIIEYPGVLITVCSATQFFPGSSCFWSLRQRGRGAKLDDDSCD